MSNETYKLVGIEDPYWSGEIDFYVAYAHDVIDPEDVQKFVKKWRRESCDFSKLNDYLGDYAFWVRSDLSNLVFRKV